MTDRKALEQREQQRAEDERACAQDTPDEAEARAHLRRAEKAEYLREKLAEADRSERSQVQRGV